MLEHPIEGLMITAMNSIKDMIDVNTIIGEPIVTAYNTIIPVSKVSFGFATGGSEFKGETVDKWNKLDKCNKKEDATSRLPFGGGSGAGISIQPVAFIVIQDNSVKVLSLKHSSGIDKMLDYMPELLNLLKNKENKSEN